MSCWSQLPLKVISSSQASEPSPSVGGAVISAGSCSTGWFDGANLVPRCRIPGRYCPTSGLLGGTDACELTAFRPTTFEEEAPVDEMKGTHGDSGAL